MDLSFVLDLKMRKMIVDDETADVPPENRGARAANLVEAMLMIHV